MKDTKHFVDKLIEIYGIEEFCGVSDSTLKYLINETTNRGIYTPFANEGSAVAYAAGRTVAGHPTAVLMQNSGLTNAASPISSLTSLYDIPLVFIVGWRGKPGIKDEPQHKIVGANTINIINTITDYNAKFINATSDGSVKFSGDFSNKNTPTFILIEPNVLSKVNNNRSRETAGISRKDCITALKLRSNSKTYFLSTTGFTSRELMSIQEDDPHNFYMLGSMGCLDAFAYGIAKDNSDKNFVVLDGDGSFLMRPDFYLTSLKYDMNIFHIIFNNYKHLSTGGQDLTMSRRIQRIFGIQSIDNIDDLYFHFDAWMNNPNPYYTCLVIDTSSDHESNLPRPKMTPQEILQNFKKGLLQ